MAAKQDDHGGKRESHLFARYIDDLHLARFDSPVLFFNISDRGGKTALWAGAVRIVAVMRADCP